MEEIFDLMEMVGDVDWGDIADFLGPDGPDVDYLQDMVSGEAFQGLGAPDIEASLPDTTDWGDGGGQVEHGEWGEGTDQPEAEADPGPVQPESPENLPPTEGFEQSGFASEGAARAALAESVPENSTAGVSQTTYKPNPPPGMPNTAGTFNLQSGEITLYDQTPTENIATFRHEVGHCLARDNPQMVPDYQNAVARDGAWSSPELDSSAYKPAQLTEEQMCEEWRRYNENPEVFRRQRPNVFAVFTRYSGGGAA